MPRGHSATRVRDLRLDNHRRPTDSLSTFPLEEVGMAWSASTRAALAAALAVAAMAGMASAADAPKRGGVLRVGNLGEPPAL